MEYEISEEKIGACRPKPFLFVTTHEKGELTYEKWREKLAELKEDGYGGFVLFNKPQNGFDAEKYLSPEWFACVRAAAKAAKELSLVMWINDGFDYPPGDVAGRVKKAAPYLKQKHLVLENGMPTVKEADWGFPAFEERESTELFIRFVYEAYEREVKEYFGDPIVGFFSDTDNRRVSASVMFDAQSPMRDYFPWSADFKKSFQNVYGYDLAPYLCDILLRKDLPQAADYWEHAGRLMQNWFAAHRCWLNKHGLEYTGHTSDSSPFLYADSPRSSCFTEGRFSDVGRHFDYAGTDQELYALDGGKHLRAESFYLPKAIFGERAHMPKMTDFSCVREDLRAKQAASTAFQYGLKGVMCEMFAATNFGVEPSVLRRIAAFQLMQGVTFIVPHAYHYRFAGETKYFAPPDFSRQSMLSYAVRELNDEFAKWACLLSEGEPIYPVALIDPTEYVWRGKFRKEEYFDAFEALNRLPYGFVVCDTEKLLSENFGFLAAVAAGIDLPEETADALEAKGIRVIRQRNSDALKDIVPCDVHYAGEGTPHFARRRMNGKEFVFVANIENDEPIRGIVTGYGRSKEIVLYPGDIRYFSDIYDDFPIEAEEKFVCDLPEAAEASFSEENILPLEVFESAGKTILKTEACGGWNAEFFVSEPLADCKLCIPKTAGKDLKKALLDGAELFAVTGKVFDEEYLFYSLPVLRAGRHRLVMQKGLPFFYYDRIFLKGNFDVCIETDKREYREIMTTYNLRIFAPEKTKIELSPRRKTLFLNRSWALQGQPFYSGGAEYSFEIEVPEMGRYALVLPQVRDVVE